MWATLIFTGAAGIFVIWTVSALWHLRWVRRLPSMETLEARDGAPPRVGPPIRCSVVVAARDEETRIEQAIRHFLYAVLNSSFVTVRQGGVRWRDTFYSLEMLRAGGVR